jgi:hypothetical protein
VAGPADRFVDGTVRRAAPAGVDRHGLARQTPLLLLESRPTTYLDIQDIQFRIDVPAPCACPGLFAT